MEGIIKSPSMLWGEFKVNKELNISVIKEYEKDNILYREVYFSGSAMCDGVTRIYAIFACPKDADKRPAILYCNDAGQGLSIDKLESIVQDGYAALVFDYSGENDLFPRHTIYPKSLDFANYIRSGEHLFKAERDAEETCWYQWTVVAKYAVEFLRQQKEVDPRNIGVLGIRSGGYFPYLLSSFDDVKCASAVFECGWTEYEGKNKYSDDNTITVDEEREKWLAGVATQVYAQHVHTPFFYLGATNDKLGNFDRVADTLSRITSENYYAIVPKLQNHVTERMTQTARMFFDKYLRNENVVFPKKPTLTLDVIDKKIYPVINTFGEKIKSVNIYYCLDTESSIIRNWKILKQPTIPVVEGEQKLFVICEVFYENGIYLTTLPMQLNLQDKELEWQQFVKNRMIYNSSMGVDGFTAISQDETLVCPTDYVRMEKGAFDILGIHSPVGKLTTFKVNEKIFSGESDSVLKFDIYAKESFALEVVADCNFLGEGGKYFIFIDILGGELWQNIEIEKSSLKNVDGIMLPQWKDIQCISFYARQKFLLNNMLWL